MPVLKAKQYDKGLFLKISNKHLREKKLSWQAKGLLDFLLSYGESYQHSFAGIMKHSSQGEQFVRTTLKELETNKYLVRQRVNNNSCGKIEWIYVVSEMPLEMDIYRDLPSSVQPHMVIPHMVTPHAVAPHAVTPHAVSHDVYNKEVPYNKETEITISNSNGSQSLLSGLTEFETKVLAWIENEPFWQSLSEDLERFKVVLNKPNSSLRKQFELATSVKPQVKTKVINHEVIQACDYCDDEGYIQFEFSDGITGKFKCDHNLDRINEMLSRHGCIDCITMKRRSKKDSKSSKIKENEALARIKAMIGQR